MKKKHHPFSDFRVKKKSQLIAASDLWFEEVVFSYKHKRFRSVLYLGGFVIECLLKAALWDRREEAQIEKLLYSHDLPKILAANKALAGEMDSDRQNMHVQFVRISSWHVRFRYNPRGIQRDDADDFRCRLDKVRTWLKQRV